MACAAIGTRWGTASCSARRVSSVARGARCVARARKARDTQTEEGGTNETRREEPPPRPGDSSGFADSARAASHGTASSSSERDSARGAFGEYLSSVQATLDAWEGTDLRNPELAGVGRRTRATRRARANGSTSGVASFLVEISQTKLLSKEEEVLLATNVQQQARVVAARVAVAERAGKDPNDVSETELARALGAASAADLETLRITANRSKQLLLRHNLRLVVSVAKKFIGRGVALEDLIQEGIGGLIRGVEGFDPTRGFKFSTYAHWWIRQAVTRSISDQSRTIRLPVHLFEIISRMSKIERRMVMKLGRDPTTEELSAAMDVTPEKIKQIKKASLVPISLNQTVNEDDKRTVEETLIDDYTENPNDATGKVLLKEDLENVLNTLNPRERDVLRLRYGLDDGRVKTLEEIGNVFSVTRERIRQIEAKALRKLRQPSRNGVLREYLPTDHEAQIDAA